MNEIARRILEETAKKLTGEKLAFVPEKDKDNAERIKWFKAVEENYISELVKIYNEIVDKNDFSPEETIAVATNLREQVSQNKGITGINIAQVEKSVLHVRRDRVNVDKGSIDDDIMNRKMNQAFNAHQVDVNVDGKSMSLDLKNIEKERLAQSRYDDFFSKYKDFMSIPDLDFKLLKDKYVYDQSFTEAYQLFDSYYTVDDQIVNQSVEKTFLYAEKKFSIYKQVEDKGEITLEDYKKLLSIQGGMLLVDNDPLDMEAGLEEAFCLAKSIVSMSQDKKMEERFSSLYERFQKQKEEFGAYSPEWMVEEFEEACKEFGIEFDREFVDRDLPPEEQLVSRAKIEMMEVESDINEYSLEEFNRDLESIQDGKSIGEDKLKLILQNGLFVTYATLMKNMEKYSVDKTSYEAMKKEEEKLKINSDEIADNSKMFLDARSNDTTMEVKETARVDSLISRSLDYLYNNTSGKENSFKSMDELVKALETSFYIKDEDKKNISQIYEEKKNNPDELKLGVLDFLSSLNKENTKRKDDVIVFRNVRLKTYIEAKNDLGDDKENQEMFLDTISKLSTLDSVNRELREINEDYLNKLRDEGHLKAYSVLMQRLKEKGENERGKNGDYYKELFSKRTQEDEERGVFYERIYNDIQQGIRNEYVSRADGTENQGQRQEDGVNFANSSIDDDGR